MEKIEYPVLIRGTNSCEVEYIFGREDFSDIQKRIHAYVVNEGFDRESVDLGVPLNPKNNFEYVRSEALPWAAWLNRNGKYVGEGVENEDTSGGYLVYFNKNALDYYVGQDKFDKPEVLSAVKLWLGGLSHFDVFKVVPLLPAGIKVLKDRVGDKLEEPVFNNRGDLMNALFSVDGMKECFCF